MHGDKPITWENWNTRRHRWWNSDIASISSHAEQHYLASSFSLYQHQVTRPICVCVLQLKLYKSIDFLCSLQLHLYRFDLRISQRIHILNFNNSTGTCFFKYIFTIITSKNMTCIALGILTPMLIAELIPPCLLINNRGHSEKLHLFTQWPIYISVHSKPFQCWS